MRWPANTNAVISISVLLALIACSADRTAPSDPVAREGETTQTAIRCDTGCVLVSSVRALAAARAKPDSTSATVQWATVRFRPANGHPLILALNAPDSVLAAAGDQAVVLVRLDGTETEYPLSRLRQGVELRPRLGVGESDLIIAVPARVRRLCAASSL